MRYDKFVTRFWNNVQKLGPNDCWLWTKKTRDKDGYGRVMRHGKPIRVHRLAYELFYGIKLAADILLRHTCDRPLCVNPTHLIPGTQTDNVADMVSRNRQARGVRMAAAKLTDAQVIELRDRYEAGETQNELAESFNLRQSTVWAILHRRAWKHVA